MYKYIEERTIGKKIELFARNKRQGWDVWGNQV
jgi:N6-adenosine-specific RNA methylase IME4